MPFNPLTLVPAAHAMWASDPRWLHPGDNEAITSMRNESRLGDPTQATAADRPLYRPGASVLGGRPAAEFISSDMLIFDLRPTSVTVAQPFKVLVVGTVTGNDQRIIGLGATTTSNGIGASAGGAWTMVGANALTGGTRDSNPHAFRATFNGASSSLLVDGSSVLTGDVGTETMEQLVLGGGLGTAGGPTGRFLTGHIGFFGVYVGTTLDSDLARLEEALRLYYGML